MPSQTGITIFGNQKIADLEVDTLNFLQLSFAPPYIPALDLRRIGVLNLTGVFSNRRFVVFSFPVFYPGIVPVYLIPLAAEDLDAELQCVRPGLSYLIEWG